MPLRIGAFHLFDHDEDVTWKKIRLELGPTIEFPSGSVTRAYLLHLPVTDEGEIDAAAILGNSRRATVRRFWPCEPDRVGRVVCTEYGWTFQCSCSELPEATLSANQIKIGGELLVTERNGPELPFRIASIRSLRCR